MRVLVTGGAGFIGSALVRELAARGHEVEVLDALTYAGDLRNLAEPGSDELIAPVHQVNICDREGVLYRLKEMRPDAIAHLAADSHVDRSFGDFQRFIRVNVGGTEVVLDAACAVGVKNVVHVSTDEVFGHVPAGRWAFEDEALNPRNPYAASKAAAEMVVRGYREYQGLPVKVIRLSNCYGPRQHVEKLIPRAISRVAAGIPVELHGGGSQIRDWLPVEDAARGIAKVLEVGKPGGTFNCPGGQERSVENVVSSICSLMGRGAYTSSPDRPGGNDLRYGMGCSAMIWGPVTVFEAGLRATIDWYLSHSDRLAEPLKVAA